MVAGLAFGAGLFTPGLWWMGEFHAVGAALAIAVEASFVAVAAALVPPGRWRMLALPGALVLADAARAVVPFGGVPLAGIGLGQVAGPLAGTARVGGELLVVGITAVAGVAMALVASRRWLAAVIALAVVVAGAVGGATAPDGDQGPTTRAAVVQGGGRRGFRGVESDPQAVLQAQLAASTLLRPPLALVVWPEDVVDVDVPLTQAPEGRAVADVARRTGSTVVAGVIESTGGRHFRNAAVAWSPAGDVVDRYEKVERVPFGEYIPLRGLVERLADVSAVPRDATAGRGPAVLRTPAGPVGVVISYEVFFSARGRAATRSGGRLLNVPTNAASFSSGQVPAQEVAAARLRAIESGRDLLQAAPTGYSAHVDHRGRVLARTGLGRRQVLHRTVTMRSGRTVYAALGDAPVLALALGTVGAAWLGRRRRPLASPSRSP